MSIRGRHLKGGDMLNYFFLPNLVPWIEVLVNFFEIF